MAINFLISENYFQDEMEGEKQRQHLQERAIKLFNTLAYLQSANEQQQNLLFLSLGTQGTDGEQATQPSKAMINGSQWD